MSQVELAAVADWGRSLVKCCYKSEKDRPLILRAHTILKDVEHTIDERADVIEWTRLKKAALKSAKIMEDMKKPRVDVIVALRLDLASATKALDESSDAVE
jgi:hypothetical protein